MGFLKKLFKKKEKLQTVNAYCVFNRNKLQEKADEEDITIEECIKKFDVSLCSTIVETEQQCVEFVFRYLLNEHYNHFKLWCSVHKNVELADDFELSDKENWALLKEYIYSTIPDKLEEYFYVKIKLNVNDLLSCTRIYYHYETVGASYESDAELYHYIKYEFSKMTEEELEALGKEKDISKMN